MSYVFAVVIGTFIGAIAGWTVTWVFDGTFDTTGSQLIIGAIAGAVFGGLIGSFVGDANATGASRHQFLIACIFGIAGGMAGATKLAIVKIVLEYIGFRLPDV